MPDPVGSLRTSVGAFILPRSILVLDGADAFDFLHRMTTNDLRDIPDRASRKTVAVNEEGRIVDLLNVVNADGRAVILCSPGAGERVAGWLDRFIFTEDVRIAAVRQNVPLMMVAGPRAESLLRLPRHAAPSTGPAPSPDPLIIPENVGAVPGFLVLPAGFDADTPRSTPDQFPGIPRLNDSVWDALRIEELVPVESRELTMDVNPLESGLKQFIDFAKGCYIGQEVIARIDTYRKLRSVIALFGFPDGIPGVPAGGVLLQEGRDAGRITSTAWSSRYNRWIGLGFRKFRMKASSMAYRPETGAPEIPCECIIPYPPGYDDYDVDE